MEIERYWLRKIGRLVLFMGLVFCLLAAVSWGHKKLEQHRRSSTVDAANVPGMTREM